VKWLPDDCQRIAFDKPKLEIHMTPTNPQIVMAKTESLIPYAMNSRTHSPEQVAQIAASIKEFGFTNPILTDGENGIIAGHGRVMAAQKLGLESVPCIELKYLTEIQRKAYVIADNKLALNAGWDIDALNVEIEALALVDFNIDLLGFTAEELLAMKPIELNAGKTDPDSCPELKDDPTTRTGDIWVMGKHRLLCGDSTSIDDIQKLCGNTLVDMWLTDPPYNVAYVGKTKEAP
jgi:hypothetical protein